MKDRCRRMRLVAHLMIFGTIGLSIPAFCQSLTSGAIGGRVTDPSGAAVAGATVIATSPALLVPQMTTQTTSTGEYKIPDLPLGTYKVTYQSSGFQQLVRENVVLTANFTATLDVALKVGNVNETVTVQAESPVVDTTQTTTGTDLNAKTLEDVIPATRNAVEIIATTPGVMRAGRPDFGGSTSSGGQYSAYGIQGQETNLKEGVNTTQSVINFGGGDSPDFNSLEEMQIVALNGSAEQANPGIMLNMIVKSGGNQFHGRYEGTWESKALQSGNLTPNLKALGISTGNSINSYESASGDLGGPLKKDKLWFYGAYNFQHSSQNALNFINPATGNVQPLIMRQQNMTGKGTYQLTPKYKLIGFYAMNTEFFNPYPTGPSQFRPYDNTPIFHWNPHQMKAELQGAPTPRLVFDILIGRQAYVAQYTPTGPPGPELDNITTGVFSGPSLTHDIRPRRSIGPSGTISYFPAGSFLGTHEFKAGGNYLRQVTFTQEPDLAPFNYELIYQNISGVATPYEISTVNYPTNSQTFQNQTGLFAQDTWHMTKRLVINLGVRFDRYSTGIPNETRTASQFATAGTFPALSTGTWNEVAPRVGVVWNVFGDNKTVLRMSWGRFNHAIGDDYAGVYNQDANTTTTYLWHAPVGSTVFTPGQTNLAVNGPDFVSITGASNQLLNLNLKDPHTNEAVVALEREIRPGLSVRVDYTWINQVNLTPYPTGGSFNILRPYSVYTVPFQVSIPAANSAGPYTANAPGSLGNITLYGFPAQYNGAAFVQNEYLNYPKSSAPITKVIDIIVTKRFAGKWGLTASFSGIRDHAPIQASYGTFLYPIPQNPNQTFFPEDTTWGWQAKSTAYYNLPWKVVMSTTFEAYNGLYGQRFVNYTAANSGIASTLGTVMVPVEPFGAESGPVRIVWNMQAGREFLFKEKFRFKPYVDLLNLLNRADQWNISFITGPTFLHPSVIDTPRIARFGAVFNF